MTRSTQHQRWSRLAALFAAAFAIGMPGHAHADARFDQAQHALSEGHYDSAAAGFEALLQTRGWSVPLLDELGNAYAGARRVGPAVLSFERARWLSPHDARAAAGLASVRASAGLPTPEHPWYQRCSRTLSSTSWTELAVAGLWLGSVAFVLAWKRRSRRWTTLATVVALIGAVSLQAAAVLDGSLDVAVADKAASLRLSPFDTAAVEANLAEGDEVAIVGRHGDFVRVRNGMGHTGWVESAAVQLIVPRSS